jgi:tetratricopeptide (TPR) repeat protein/DNA-binding XRE family transcriptional regulator
VVAVDPPVVAFAGLLRQLRIEAGLSQEELAGAAGVGVRTVSDLERGVALTARKDTARLLADALNLSGAARASFEAVARGRAAPGVSPAPGGGAAGAGGAAAASRTLPRDIGSFTGRQPELGQLVGAASGSSRPGVVSIHAIGGMAGIGKTALAVHAAHQLAPRFPDGQIFLPLHGHTPGQRPVDPADALASLLLTAGVAPALIPPGLEARMALWRDRLAGKQLLLVLDDAASSDQVRPLLPGAGGSLVLVTSRRHLSALEDAQTLSLDTLPPEEAAGLLVRLAGRAGLSPDDLAVGEITRLCGYLPLAIGMLARQLHHHPAWTASDLAADLAAARDRLELMRAENLSVAVAFGLSYADLSSEHQRLFRRLGLHPGTDIDGYAAAALDGTDLAAARRDLEALYDHYLIAEPTRGRYRLHDLIREHARALAATDDPSEQEAATSRVLDYYLRTAAIAEARLARQSRTRSDSPAPASPLTAVPDLPDRARALAWARAERANLLACLDHAARTGQHARVVALTAAMAYLLQQDGPWTDAITRHTTAITAAREVGDRLGQAGALGDLGEARRLTGDFQGAGQAHEEALGIYRDLGDRRGQANASRELGALWSLTGDYPVATQALEAALGLYRDLADRRGQARTLRNLGAMRLWIADFPGATQALEEALGIFLELGDQRGQANTIMDVGNIRDETGDYPGAAQALEEAMGIFQDIGDRRGQAIALLNLGAVRAGIGDYLGAIQTAEETLRIFRDLGDRLFEAGSLLYLGVARGMTGDYPGATEALEEALAIVRDLGDRCDVAEVLRELGAVRRMVGDYPRAAQALEEALPICRDLGDRGREAATLNELGTLRQVRGSPERAGEYHRQALKLAREIGSPRFEADALAGLGRCALGAGRTAEAQTSLRQALEILQRIGAAEAPDLAAELEALTRPQQDREQ